MSLYLKRVCLTGFGNVRFGKIFTCKVRFVIMETDRLQPVNGDVSMKVLNMGSMNLDYVYTVDHIVLPGETEDSGSRSIFLGGKGMNQSCGVLSIITHYCLLLHHLSTFVNY